MTTKAHSTLTGSDLHEPKGISTANAGQVYVSDGSGGGSWQDTAATAGANNLTTGDLKPTWKIVADAGWIMCDDGTIGDLSSGASTLASATTQDLFTLLWNNFANAQAAVSSGRGVSAASDYAAHKTIALPKMLGRVYGIAGAGAGLTSRVMGVTAGAENVTLDITGIPAHSHGGVTGGQSQGHTHGYVASQQTGFTANPDGGAVTDSRDANSTTGGASNDHTHTIPSEGGSGSHPNVQPTVFLKMMVKL